MKGTLCLFAILSQLLPAAAQVKNTLLGEIGGEGACASAIAVNPRNPSNIVVVSGRGNSWITKDGGASWKEGKVASGSNFLGNPVLFADDKGGYHLLSLFDSDGESPGARLAFQRSGDGGETWADGDVVAIDPSRHVQNPWAIRDGKGNWFATWMQFEGGDLTDPGCKASVFFSMSKNGKKWSDPTRIGDFGRCLLQNTTGAAVPAVTYDGKAMIAWSGNNKILLDRSFNGGEWWLSNDITVADQKGGSSLLVPGHGSCNATPILMTDLSKSHFRGSLYIVWSDQRNGEHDTDVWFTRSHNFGDNWSLPTRVNNDGSGRHQYMPWMTVDQATGYIYVLYYDRRDHEDNSTDVYLAWSADGGASFHNKLISESPFTPEERSPVGAFINVSAHKGTIAPVWSRVDDGKVSVWTAVLKQEDLAKKD